MVQYQDYISENEAVSLTGISPTTLERFAKAGYLQVEPDNDGLKFYSRTELEKLFGVTFAAQEQPAQPAPESSIAATSSTDQPSENFNSNVYSFPDHEEQNEQRMSTAVDHAQEAATESENEDESYYSETTVKSEVANRIIQDSIDHLRRDYTVAAKEAATAEESGRQSYYSTPLFKETDFSEHKAKSEPVHEPRFAKPPVHDKIRVAELAKQQKEALGNSDLTADQREIVKLKNIIRLQEQILDLKDSEIVDLQSQRKWLQARIEKLEEKYDRSQILLLSETQTMNKLISMHYERKNPLKAAIAWIGDKLSPPTLPVQRNNSYNLNSARPTGGAVEQSQTEKQKAGNSW